MMFINYLMKIEYRRSQWCNADNKDENVNRFAVRERVGERERERETG